eukprot:1156796-Pelagomonas_calceolata.AAC.7
MGPANTKPADRVVVLKMFFSFSRSFNRAQELAVVGQCTLYNLGPASEVRMERTKTCICVPCYILLLIANAEGLAALLAVAISGSPHGLPISILNASCKWLGVLVPGSPLVGQPAPLPLRRALGAFCAPGVYAVSNTALKSSPRFPLGHVDRCKASTPNGAILCGLHIRDNAGSTWLSLITTGDKYCVGTKGWIGLQVRKMVLQRKIHHLCNDTPATLRTRVSIA